MRRGLPLSVPSSSKAMTSTLVMRFFPRASTTAWPVRTSMPFPRTAAAAAPGELPRMSTTAATVTPASARSRAAP